MTPENDPKDEAGGGGGVTDREKRTTLCGSQLAFQENSSDISQHIWGT